jgi:hypothetical protein
MSTHAKQLMKKAVPPYWSGLPWFMKCDIVMNRVHIAAIIVNGKGTMNESMPRQDIVSSSA